MLGYDLSRPPGAADGTRVTVLLHGRGSHRGDLQALRPHLPDDMVLVTPQAPNPGHPWGYGPGWAWYRHLAEDRVVEETLTASLRALDAFLSGLPEILGFRPGRVFLGGFSQGGTVSLAYGLTRPTAVDAVLNFSGFLAAGARIDADAPADGPPPVFWGHGTRDPNIPFSLARKGRAHLESVGVRVWNGDYEIGHWIAPQEVRDAVDFLSGLAPDP